MQIRITALSLTLLLLTACGSGGGGSTGGSKSSAVQSSSSSSVSSSSSSVSSDVSSPSSSSASSESSASSVEVIAGVIPNAAGNNFPYCRHASNENGWGWEDGHNCIVYQSVADPGPGAYDHCKVGAEEINYCSGETPNWSYTDNSYCIANDFCPGNAALSQSSATDNLANPNASATTQAVFHYLSSIWGSKMLSGQMDLTWEDSVDMHQRVLDATGKSPALMGYDFMNYGVYNNISGLQQTEEAIEYWQDGGLVTFTWHWRDPSDATVFFYATQDDPNKNTAFQIPVKNGQLDTASSEFTAIEQDVDLIAVELKKLADADVPVLWRPLHEAAGGWFWWGRQRTDDVPAAYAQILLWDYLYDRLTNHHGINNLIWVWNGQSAVWYPGDATVDIVSTDIYDGTQNYESQISMFELTKNFSQQQKMVALSENSNIPDPDAMLTDNAWWLWFMVWNDGALDTLGTHENNFWIGEHYNTDSHKQHVYAHELVITRDELPSFNEF